MAASESQEEQTVPGADAFVDALKRELESELVSGWRVDEEAVWLGSTRLLTLGRYRKGFESCRWVDDRLRFVSSILRDELDRVAPMPKSYDQAVSSLRPRLRWTSDVESRALAMDSLLGGKARSPVGFSVSALLFAELVVQSKGLWRRVSRRELEAWGSDQLAPAQRARQNLREAGAPTWTKDDSGLWVSDVRDLGSLILPETVTGHPIEGAWVALQSEDGRLWAAQLDDEPRIRLLLNRETETAGLSPESFLLRPHADGLVDLFRAETLHLGCEDHIEKRRRLYRDHYQRARAILERLMRMRGGQGQLGSYALSSDHQRSFTDVTTTRDALVPKVDVLVIEHEGDARELDWKTLRSMTGGAALKGQGFSPEWFFLSSAALTKIHSMLSSG